MASWQQKKRANDNRLGAEFDATVERHCNRWFSKFHMGRFDDLVARMLLECFRNSFEQCVAFGDARAVIDDDVSSGWHAGSIPKDTQHGFCCWVALLLRGREVRAETQSSSNL